MDGLKALLAKKRKAADAEFGGRKQVRRVDIEQARIKQLRTEEQHELQAKDAKRALKRAADGSGELQRLDSGARTHSEEALPLEEVIRRLRLLGQPATLFGEEELERSQRLRQAQQEFEIDDDMIGGQQGNSLLELIKQGKLHAKKAPPAKKEDKAAANSRPVSAGPTTEVPSTSATSREAVQAGTDGEDEVEASFKAAAKRLRLQRQEEQMPIEDRLNLYLKRWTAEWAADLEARSEEVKDSSSGYTATIQFQQTMSFFKPLFKQLKRRQIDPDMKAGLWMICEAFKERNYLFAYDIYMRLAVGNNPWPIGVTSIGIHERSSREKISHVMNGSAHIMNDEATRKYLQAVKRLLTFLQRAYPTDPSRSVDFDGFRDAGLGAKGAGSDKAALIEAEKKGETWKHLGLLPAPHHVGADGVVQVPPKWENMVLHSEAFKEHQAAEKGQTRKASPLKAK
ncbi:hypothetical protein ABBQ38_003458 [Trebouxia sp. C0009 RCD-2024]